MTHGYKLIVTELPLRTTGLLLDTDLRWLLSELPADILTWNSRMIRLVTAGKRLLFKYRVFHKAAPFFTDSLTITDTDFLFTVIN